MSLGGRHAIGKAATTMEDAGVVIVGIFVHRLSTGVTVDNDKVLI